MNNEKKCENYESKLNRIENFLLLSITISGITLLTLLATIFRILNAISFDNLFKSF